MFTECSIVWPKARCILVDDTWRNEAFIDFSKKVGKLPSGLKGVRIFTEGVFFEDRYCLLVLSLASILGWCGDSG